MCNSIAQDVLACSENVYAQWETRQQWRERAVRATITTCWHTRAMTTDNTYTSHDTSHANMDVDNANNVNTVHNPTYRNVLRVSLTRRPMWRCTDESSGQIRSMSWRYIDFYSSLSSLSCDVICTCVGCGRRRAAPAKSQAEQRTDRSFIFILLLLWLNYSSE